MSPSRGRGAAAPLPPIPGLDPGVPTHTNEFGGSQAHVQYRFDLADPASMFKMCKVLHEGAEKYGVDNWRSIPVEDHLNHLILHAYAYLAGDTSDEHLAHAMCRAMFALGVSVQGGRPLQKKVSDA